LKKFSMPWKWLSATKTKSSPKYEIICRPNSTQYLEKFLGEDCRMWKAIFMPFLCAKFIPENTETPIPGMEIERGLLLAGWLKKYFCDMSN
jgi:hypothetical protein